MSYDDIIAKIKSDLTGNTDKDKAYLIKQFKIHNLKENPFGTWQTALGFDE